MPRTMSITGDQLRARASGAKPSTVDVAEATGFTLLCMVKPTSPIDGNITLAPVKAGCALHTATSTDTAKFEEAVEDRTIIADIESALLLLEVFHVIRRHSPEEINVFVRVKLGHLHLGRRFCSLNILDEFLKISFEMSQSKKPNRNIGLPKVG